MSSRYDADAAFYAKFLMGKVSPADIIKKFGNAIVTSTTTQLWTPASGKRCVLVGFAVQATGATFAVRLQDSAGTPNRITIDIFGTSANPSVPIFIFWPHRNAAVDTRIDAVTTGTPGSISIMTIGYEE